MTRFSRRTFLRQSSRLSAALPFGLHRLIHLENSPGVRTPTGQPLFESIPASASGIRFTHTNGRSPNYYLPEKRMGSTVQVGVSYTCDPDHVERVLLEVAVQGTREIPGMVSDPAPSVVFDPGFGDSSIAVTLNFQVADFASQAGVRHQLRKRIVRRFKQEGIEMPFPSRAVYLHQP